LFIKIKNIENCKIEQIATMFREKNILVSIWSPTLLRMVFHRDITKTDIIDVEKAVHTISYDLINRFIKID
jgi:hypothetical protein